MTDALSKMHNVSTCNTCIGYREAIKIIEGRMRALTAGTICLADTMDTLVEQRDVIHKARQAHLDERFDSMPDFLQVEVYHINPKLATDKFREKFKDAHWYKE